MINQSLLLIKDGPGYLLRLDRSDNHDLAQMSEKFGGMVNVKISKPETPGSEYQNRAMHALLAAYYTTGMHTAPGEFAKSLGAFKVYLKVQHGPCYCMTEGAEQIKIPKSWAQYTKQERMQFIDCLIAEIHQTGAYNAHIKVKEIIDGMGEK